jgi:hypothetical protein
LGRVVTASRVKRMVLGLSLASGIFAFSAAVFWFISAANQPPPMVTYWDGAPPTDTFYASLAFGARMNRWAAFFSGLSAVCASAGVFLTTRIG